MRIRCRWRRCCRAGGYRSWGSGGVQKDLGKLLRQISADPKSFYEGDIARTIVKQVRANGGILAEEDFSRFEARVVEPLSVNYRGYDLHTPPPPAAGVTTLGILKTLEDFDLASREKWGAPYFELYSEASRLCWDERRRLLGDPDVVHPPLEAMLSEEIRQGARSSDSKRPAAAVFQLERRKRAHFEHRHGRFAAESCFADRNSRRCMGVARRDRGFGIGAGAHDVAFYGETRAAEQRCAGEARAAQYVSSCDHEECEAAGGDRDAGWASDCDRYRPGGGQRPGFQSNTCQGRGCAASAYRRG